MAEKTIAERIYTAYLTGGEATFTENGITYTFTPEGLEAFISAGAAPLYTDEDAINAVANKEEVTELVALDPGEDDLSVIVSTINEIITALQSTI